MNLVTGRCLFFKAMAVLAISQTLSFGQATGSIRGSVVDSSSAAVPNAEVRVFLPGGQRAILTTKTTSDGVFSISALRPSVYDLTITAPGFNKMTLSALKVEPARETPLAAVQLQVGSVDTTVVVSDVTTAVQIASSDVSSTISQQQVHELPVFDRQVSTVYITQAGVSNSRTTTSINGLRPSFTNVTVDGINIQDSVRTNGLDYNPAKLTIDEIEELTISTSNTESTVGGNATSISIVTPSGTNTLHGSLYWFNRNSALSANDWFNNRNGVARPFENLNQMGGTIKGPVVKDKLLYFINLEAFRDKANLARTRTILTPEARQGIFRYRSGGVVQSFNVLTAQQLTADPFMQSLISQLPTAGNNDAIGDGLNTTGYSFNARNNTSRNKGTGKLDYYLSERNTFTGTYKYNGEVVDRGDTGSFYGVTPPVTNDNRFHFVSAAWRSNIVPTITNELRGGFTHQPGGFFNSLKPPAFFVTGMNFSTPVNDFQPQIAATNTQSLQDNAQWTSGKHTVSFGGQLARYHSNPVISSGIVPSYALGYSAQSQYGFVVGAIPGATATDISRANGLLASVAGILTSGSQSFNATSRTSGFVSAAPSNQNFSMVNYAPYVQDKWKLTRKLTMTLGLRWEYFSPVDERDGLYVQPRADNGNAVEALLGNATLDFAGRAVGRPLSKRDLNNFAPYVGFAVDPFGDGKTSIRGAYSIAYGLDNNINSIYNASTANNGLFATRSLGNFTTAFAGRNLPAITAPPFRVPTTSEEQFNLNPASPPVQSLIDPNLATPYVQQWNLSIQRQIKSVLIEARYVGNHALKMLRQVDYNQINVNQGTYLRDFRAARNNGLLASAAGRGFDPRFNSAVPGSVAVPFFDSLPAAGLLNNTAVSGPILRNEAGSLAQLYQVNGILPNANFTFFPNRYTLYSALQTSFSHSNYNAFQLEARKRLSFGLTFQGNYTYSKVLSDSLAGRGLEAVLDNNNWAIERSRAPFDVTHSIKLNHLYELPFGRGKRFASNWGKSANYVIGGWTLTGLLHLDSGPPVSFLSARGTLNRGARSGQNTVNSLVTREQLRQVTGLFITGNGPYFVNPANINPIDGTGIAADGTAAFNGQLFTYPEAGGLGSLQRRSISGPGYRNYNFGLRKSFQFNERHNLDLRMDAYNLFNHPSFFVGDQTVSSTTFGRITGLLGSGENTLLRAFQFGLYYKF